MRRIFIIIVIFAAISLVVWLFWSSKTEIDNSVLIIKQNYFSRNILISPSNTICNHKPLVVIIVTSYVGHVELRSAHRKAMPPDLLKSMNVRRIFLLARIPEKEKYITQEAIENESNTFRDILQGSFLENYRNLTHKHLMGLQWASTICSKASFILKVDDDTVFDFKSTYMLLLNMSNTKGDDFLLGYMLNNTKPKRNKQSKWYVTNEEYPRNTYPPYLSGWYYITTPNVATMLSEESIYHPYFWIDDILITGLFTEALGIKLRQLPKGYWLEYYELLECCLKDMITKYIRCDSVVGPNGGRNNLIVEFNEALTHCDIWKNCTSRPLDLSLNKVCVAYKERSIFSDGQAEVQNIRL